MKGRDLKSPCGRSRRGSSRLVVMHSCGYILLGMAVNADPGRLTERQREVLAGVCRGLSNREIAAELGITEEGVKAHLARLYLRFGVRNRVALLAATSPAPLDATTSLGALRVMATETRRQVDELNGARPRGGSLDTRFGAVREALGALDAALEIVAELPPTATGQALKAVRKRTSVALTAMRELEDALRT